MTAFQQISHDSQNLLDEEVLTPYVGAVLSPVNYTAEKTAEFTTRLRTKRSGTFEFVLDPQLYFPHSERELLRQWSYFPKDFDSADRTSLDYWTGITDKVVKAGMDLRTRYIASPADVPKIYDNAYFERLAAVGSYLAQTTNDRFEPMQSLIVGMRDLADPTRALKIASLISATECPWVYLMLDTDLEPRREFADSEQLLGVMQIIHSLERANLRVMVAYSSSDVVLWKAAGATACASGKFFNVRRFTRSRFEAKKDGGGNVEYWFEESLLAFIRQTDLLRLFKEKMLSEATLTNPIFHEVMESIKANKAWLRWSWLQYMYWFADVERRLTSGKVTASELVESADRKWSELDKKKVYILERENNGEWLRTWLQALADFDKWKQEY